MTHDPSTAIERKASERMDGVQTLIVERSDGSNAIARYDPSADAGFRLVIDKGISLSETQARDLARWLLEVLP